MKLFVTLFFVRFNKNKPPKMKKILVPTDFSEQAENALKVAAQFARKYDSEIYLLHMLELPMQNTDPAMTTGNQIPEALYFMKLARNRFEEVLSRDYLEGLRVYETVQFHQAFDGIMEFTKQNDVDLVVMGSHGATGMKEIFIGSNTEKVVRNSDIPVLVVKNELIISEVNNMVYATDLMKKNKESFTEAVKFSQMLNAKMHVVYINTSSKFKTDDYLIDKSTKFLEDLDTSNLSFEVYGAESIEKGILKYAAKKNANLIGISTHGRKGLAHFLNGSISEDLVNHAKTPVITFRIK